MMVPTPRFLLRYWKRAISWALAGLSPLTMMMLFNGSSKSLAIRELLMVRAQELAGRVVENCSILTRFIKSRKVS